MKAPERPRGDFVIPPAGMHVGICIKMVALGLQPPYPGSRFPKDQFKLWLQFELPEASAEGVEGPLVVSQEYTHSMYKSHLLSLVEGWRGKKFRDQDEADDYDLRPLLGRACYVNIIHDVRGDRTYAKIQSVSQLPSNVGAPEPHNDLIYYDNDKNTDRYDKLPNWIKKKLDNQVHPDHADYPEPKLEKADTTPPDSLHEQLVASVEANKQKNLLEREDAEEDDVPF